MKQELIWDYFQTRGREAFSGSLARLAFLAKQVGMQKVLNIGVGDGMFERQAINAGANVYSLDPSEDAIERLRHELGLGEKAAVGYIHDIKFSNGSFDAVVVSEVLEHLDDETLRKGLKEVERVLRPGGHLLGTVPARENLQDQMVVCPHCGERFHRWGHSQSFDVARLRELLTRSFEVKEISERIFITWGMLNWKGKFGGMVKWFLFRLGVHGSNESLYFVARKPNM